MKTFQSVLQAADISGRIRTVTKHRWGISAFRVSFSRIWALTKDFAVCALAVLCLAAAGSDGPYFPWPNIAGLAVMAVIVSFIGKKQRHP